MKKWAYYSEFEPYAVDWLRNLIAKGLIAPGEVDERSIVDVQPDDLKGFVQCHFFAGIGGWSLAARKAGWPDDRPIWSASCPCQPFSVAGKGEGQADERHLWPIFFELFRARRPAFLVGEQVAAAVGKDWLDGVHTDLESVGYASRAVVVPACAVNAPHRRDRLWFVAAPLADAERVGREMALLDAGSGSASDRDRQADQSGMRGPFGDAMADPDGARSLPGAHAGIRGGEEGAGPRHVESERHGSEPVADAERGLRDGRSIVSVGRPEGRDAAGWFGSGDRSPVAEPDSVAERQGNPFAGGCYDGDRAGEEPGLGGACDGDVVDAIEERRDSGSGLLAPGQRSTEFEGFDRGPFGGDVADAASERSQGRASPGQQERAPDFGSLPSGPGEFRNVADAECVDDDGRRLGTGDVRGERSGASDLFGGYRHGLDVVDAFGTGLEGFSRNGSDGCEPGWIDADAARPITPSGGVVSDADLAGSGAEREQRGREFGGAGGYPVYRHWDAAIWIVGADGKARRVGSRLCSVVDGFPDDVAGMRAGGYAEIEIETIPLLAHGVKARVGKLRAFGNAIVPDLAAEIIGAYLDTHP